MQIHRSLHPTKATQQKSLSQTANSLRKQQNIKNWVEKCLNKQHKGIPGGTRWWVELNTCSVFFIYYLLLNHHHCHRLRCLLCVCMCCCCWRCFFVVVFFLHKASAFVYVECYSSLALLASPWIAFFFLLLQLGTGYWMLSRRRAFRVNQLIFMRTKGSWRISHSPKVTKKKKKLSK